MPAIAIAMAIAIAAICLPRPAAAHDFWIEPAAFHPSIGASLSVSLRVGEEFNGTSVPYTPQRIVDFSVVSAAGRETVAGAPGDDPAASLEFETPGLRLIGYRSNRAFVRLDAGPFDAYLQAEGLEQIRELRRARGQQHADGREYYSRCSKSLLNVSHGAGPTHGAEFADSVYDRELGYPLELILRANPYALAPGDPLPLVIHYLGKPLAGVLVFAFTADTPAQKFQARTDADGRVTVPLDRTGRWLIKAVQMIELPDNEAADWESFWASLTFEVGHEVRHADSQGQPD